jgi:tight adherence protein B
MLILAVLVFLTVFSFMLLIYSYSSYNRLLERSVRPKEKKRALYDELFQYWGVTTESALTSDKALTVAIASALAFALIGYLMGSLFITFGVAVLGFILAPRFVEGFMKRAKIKAFRANMEFVVNILLGCLESGMVLENAIVETARTSPGEVKEDLRQVAVAVEQIGLSPAEAFAMLARRVPCTETKELCDAIGLYTKVGGREALNLIKAVMDNIREGANARHQVEQEVKGIKTSGLIVGILPIGYVLGMFLISPDLIKVLFESQIGKGVLIGCFALYIFGALLMWTILKGVEEF